MSLTPRPTRLDYRNLIPLVINQLANMQKCLIYEFNYIIDRKTMRQPFAQKRETN